MQKAMVIKGRLVGPKNVELAEAVLNALDEVDVIVRTSDGGNSNPSQDISEFLRRLPLGTRSRQDIDRQIHEEREAWKEGS